jgi:hypothetical protein
VRFWNKNVPFYIPKNTLAYCNASVVKSYNTPNSLVRFWNKKKLLSTSKNTLAYSKVVGLAQGFALLFIFHFKEEDLITKRRLNLFFIVIAFFYGSTFSRVGKARLKR